MSEARVGNINIYYEVHGQGEPLVVISGAGAGMDWFRRLIPVYSREYQLVLFDNRGVGRSDRPDMIYTTAMMADDLAGLLDSIGIGDAHIRGGSFGGMIAQQFAVRHPKRVRTLILSATYCGGKNSIMVSLPRTKDLQVLSPREIAEVLFRSFITEEFINKHQHLFEQLVAFAEEHPIDPVGLAKHAEAIANHDTYDRLPEISVPTLVVAGDADRVIPFENAGIIASRIPNAELVILKNAGHMLIEAAEEVERLALDFLRRHRTAN